jgi:hypothetical protein
MIDLLLPGGAPCADHGNRDWPTVIAETAQVPAPAAITIVGERGPHRFEELKD